MLEARLGVLTVQVGQGRCLFMARVLTHDAGMYGKKIKEGEQSKKEAMPTVSRYFSDGTIVELIYNPEQGQTAFAVCRNGEWSIGESFVTPFGEKLVPFSPNNNLIKNEMVLLPSEPREYGTEQDLLGKVRTFIHRYVDVRSSFEEIASHYVLLTWLYDAFNEMPYLRLRGDWGSGKTRALLTLGSLCYKGFFASGASTVSPIFHILDAFGGTLILDEADFRFSDEKAEVVKILNNGNARGMPVLRTMMNRQREFNPRAFKVFGPKIVASRSAYDDQGLESRFITEDMGARKLRPDIPINLPPSFREEAWTLRNELLLYRFHRLPSVRLDPGLAGPTLEPRLNQILLPLLSIIEDPKLRDALRTAAFETQSTIVAERGLSIAAQVLEVLAHLMRDASGAGVSVGAVAKELAQRYGSQYERPISDRWVGGILRKRLNLRTYKSHGVFVVPISERSSVEHLCARYGIGPNNLVPPESEIATIK